MAFAISWNKPSLLVSSALVATGALMVIDGITTGTRYFTVLVLPGPIIGFVYGLAILALEIVERQDGIGDDCNRITEFFVSSGN